MEQGTEMRNPRNFHARSVDDPAKELSETLYWLRLIDGLGLLAPTTQAITGEADELVAILVASASTAPENA